MRFSIRAESLADALLDFALQAGVSIDVPPAVSRIRRAPALNGDWSRDAALERLLAGSGFTFQRLDAHAYRIRPAPKPSTPSVVAPQGPERPVEVAEVVVSAKRPRELDKVAASLTSLSGGDLDRAGARDNDGLAFAAAGLTFTNLGPGRDKVLIRGLSDGAFTGRSQSTVAVYLDESRATYAAPDPDLQLVDIESVEVLRGPQGALYGAGSVGGVLRIVTRKPDLDQASGWLSAGIDQTAGGGAGSDFEAVVNAPLVKGALGVRAVAWRQSQAGWLDTPLLGGHDTNRTLRQGFRGAALWDAGDFRVTLGAAHQGIESEDSQYAALDGHSRAVHLLEPHDNDFSLAYATVEGATDWGRLSSTTSLVGHEIVSRYDATGAFTALGVPAAAPTPFDDDQRLEIWVHETRLSDDNARFPWLIGAFASGGESRRTDTLRTGTPNLWSEFAYQERRTDELLEGALFGEVAAPLGHGLTLTVGARAFASRLKTRSRTVEPGVGQAAFDGEVRGGGLAPQVSLSWTPRAGLLIYAQASEGYRAPGLNTGGLIGQSLPQGGGAPQPFRRYGGDELWNLEAGTRLTALDGRLQFRGAVFWTAWSHVQTDQLLSGGLPFTGNIGDARNRGIELEGVWRPSAGLTLNGHLTLDEPEVTRADPSFPAAVETGLPGAPKVSGGLGLAWRRPLGRGWQVDAGAQGLWVGRSPATFDAGQKLTVGGYGVVNLQAGLENSRWRLALHLDNATNSDGPSFSYGNPFRFGAPDAATPLKPRTIGLTLSRAFF